MDLTFLVVDVDSNRKTGRIQLYGRTEDGRSIVCRVSDFRHYFYVRQPPSYRGAAGALRLLRDDEGGRACPAIEALESTQREDIYYYKAESERLQPMFRVVLRSPSGVDEARNFLKGKFPRHAPPQFYEDAAVTHGFRFMIDIGLKGMAWVTVPANRFSTSSEPAPNVDRTVEARSYRDLIAHPPTDPRWSGISPLRVLCYDLECRSADGRFPSSDRDPIISVGVSMLYLGEKRLRWTRVLHLRNSDPPSNPDFEYVACADERELLRAFFDLLRREQPDFVTGWNTAGFDDEYAYTRARRLGLEKDFCSLSQNVDEQASLKKDQFSSAAYGTREYRRWIVPFRICFDEMEVMRRSCKLSSYSLNSVLTAFLTRGDVYPDDPNPAEPMRKADVHHSMIAANFDGDPESRQRLFDYNAWDAALPLLLLMKLQKMFELTGMARVTGVPIRDVIHRGQAIKVLLQILARARDKGLVLPVASGGTKKRAGDAGILDDDEYSSDEEDEGGKKPKTKTAKRQKGYEGAVVVDPKVGYYRKPVVVLDFAALYPSTMIAHNICYRTLLPLLPRPGDLERLGLKEYDVTAVDVGGCVIHRFVKAHVHRGLVPEMLEALLCERSRAKKEKAACLAKAAAKDETEDWNFQAAVKDAEQLALKLSANSVYGFTGFPAESGGKLPCQAVAASTTALGRAALHKICDYVRDHYPDFDVIYGDTDSIFVATPFDTVDEALEWGGKAASEITEACFADLPPMRLEFEKVLCPLILEAKKRYAGGYYERPGPPKMVLYKGIEIARRDWCELVTNVLKRCYEAVCLRHDIEGAMDIARETVRSVYLGEVPYQRFIVSKTYNPPKEGPQSVVAGKIASRDSGKAPKMGDRVPYVYVQTAKADKKLASGAEDPLYALETGMRIDTTYYLERQLRGPLKRLFEPIVGTKRTAELFSGEHTRKRRRSDLDRLAEARSAVGGTIGSFFTAKKPCELCHRAVLNDKDPRMVCRECAKTRIADIEEIRARVTAERDAAEDEYGRRYGDCLTCYAKPEECVQRDCERFYYRYQAKRRRDHAEEKLGVLLDSSNA